MKIRIQKVKARKLALIHTFVLIGLNASAQADLFEKCVNPFNIPGLEVWLEFDEYYPYSGQVTNTTGVDTVNGTLLDIHQTAPVNAPVNIVRTYPHANLSNGPAGHQLALQVGTNATKLAGSSHPWAEYGVINGNANLEFGTDSDFTIDFWIKQYGCTSTFSTRTPCYGAILGTMTQDQQYPNWPQGWRIRTGHWNDIRLELIDDMNMVVTNNLLLPNYANSDGWVHLTYAVSRTDGIKTYANGNLIHNKVVDTSAMNISTGKPILIGGDYSYTNSGAIYASAGVFEIDEIEIFSRNLHPKDINRIVKGKCKTMPLNPQCNEKGLTWIQKDHDNVTGTIRVGTDYSSPPNGSNAYNGDRLCSQALPLLCFNETQKFPKPVTMTNVPDPGTWKMHAWSEGVVATTPPIKGCDMATISDANKVCEDNFGAGWRAADHHDGVGWSFWAYGGVGDPDGRFWVDNDGLRGQATCWK